MTEEEARKAFEKLIVNIQGSYQDWEDFCTVLKQAKLNVKDLKVAKKIFDRERLCRQISKCW